MATKKKSGNGTKPKGKQKAAQPAKATPKQEAKTAAPAPASAPAELEPLRAKVEEAKTDLTKAQNEANALRLQAKALESVAKKAYVEALSPYRDACKRTRTTCEFSGFKAPSVLPRARFLVERTDDGGLKVGVHGRPETEETITSGELARSVWRAARDYCTRHFGEQLTDGRCRGLGLRFRSMLAKQ